MFYHKESELLHDFIVTHCVFSFQNTGSGKCQCSTRDVEEALRGQAVESGEGVCGEMVLRRQMRNVGRKGGKLEAKWIGPYRCDLCIDYSIYLCMYYVCIYACMCVYVWIYTHIHKCVHTYYTVCTRPKIVAMSRDTHQ